MNDHLPVKPHRLMSQGWQVDSRISDSRDPAARPRCRNSAREVNEFKMARTTSRLSARPAAASCPRLSASSPSTVSTAPRCLRSPTRVELRPERSTSISTARPTCSSRWSGARFNRSRYPRRRAARPARYCCRALRQCHDAPLKLLRQLAVEIHSASVEHPRVSAAIETILGRHDPANW